MHREQLRALILEHAPLVAVVALYVAAGAALNDALGVDLLSLNFAQESLNTIALAALIFALSAHAAWMLPRTPQGVSVFVAIWRDLRGRFLTLRRLGGLAVVLVLFPVFSSTYFAIKLMLPKLQPFAWDARLYQLDQALHLGHDPWRLLHPIFGNAVGSIGLNVAYNGWMMVLLTVLVWQALSARRALRFRFFMTFLLMWMSLGSALGTLLSSAGPCYYGRVVGGPDPYAPLMRHLWGVHDSHVLWAVETQEVLWQAHETGVVETVAGISAMPSLHVAVATLLAALGWASHRALGVAFTAFAVVILLGSVHLGWHYALDGYVGGAGALALWWAVGWVMERLNFKPADEPLPPPPPRVTPSGAVQRRSPP